MRYAFRLLALAGTTVCGVFSLLLLVVIPYQYIQTYKLVQSFPTNRLGNNIGFHRFPIYRVPSDIKHLAPFIVGLYALGLSISDWHAPAKMHQQYRKAWARTVRASSLHTPLPASTLEIRREIEF